MRSISDTIARLSPHAAAPTTDRLTNLAEPFSNPGALDARLYIPDDLAAGAALVVVLHGCTQSAAGYDHGSGWSEIADAHGFALLFPEQTRANNPNRCFNWFADGDITRGHGEVASIAEMIGATVERYGLDPARVFITGLSAGGAMTASMLATYPELFAAGAIIAGLPHGVARSVPQALERMRGQGLPDARALTRAVHDASPGRSAWPVVSVWHGSADHTVVAAVGEAVIAQWLGVHGLDQAPEHDIVDGQAHRVWRDSDGRALVEAHVIAGMGHGTPLHTEDCGTAGAHMLDVGISSTLRIAESWGLVPARASRAGPATGRGEAVKPMPSSTSRPIPMPSSANQHGALSAGVGKVIEDALRTAGLMR